MSFYRANNPKRIAEFREQVLTPKTKRDIWTPEAGDMLIGEIVDIGGETLSSRFSRQPIMKVQTERTSVVKVALNQWLVDNLREQQARQGDLIALTFGGKKRTTGGKLYNSYNLMVEK